MDKGTGLHETVQKRLTCIMLSTFVKCIYYEYEWAGRVLLEES
jgi:hypothetical protein